MCWQKDGPMANNSPYVDFSQRHKSYPLVGTDDRAEPVPRFSMCLMFFIFLYVYA